MVENRRERSTSSWIRLSKTGRWGSVAGSVFSWSRSFLASS